MKLLRVFWLVHYTQLHAQSHYAQLNAYAEKKKLTWARKFKY